MEINTFTVVRMHKKRQIASLSSHAFRDLPFSISLLTDSLVYFVLGAVGGSQNKCIRRYFFLPFSFSPFPQKKKKKKKKKPDCSLPQAHKVVHKFICVIALTIKSLQKKETPAF